MFEFLKKISSMEAKIAELEARIAALEKQNKKLAAAAEKYEKAAKAAVKKDKKARKEADYQQALKTNIPKVMEKTGWDWEYAEMKYLDAKKRTECTPKEYYMYRFYELSDEEQATMFLITHQRKLRKKFDTRQEFVNIICNKEKTNLYFSELVRRPWCVNTKASFEEFCEVFKDTKRIMYKPTGGHRGFGIEAFYITPENMQEVYDKLKTYPEGVVEEFVNQHPEMSRLSPASVNSLRFVTLSSFEHPVTPDGKNADVAYSIVRIGRGDSIVDNLHSGGMVANVDLETGCLATNGADRNGFMFEAHPESGTVIKGFKVPYFEEARELILKTIMEKKVEGYLGWDIAISVDGPKLLEVNTCPGADGLQTAHAQEGRGMKYVMDKYL